MLIQDNMQQTSGLKDMFRLLLSYILYGFSGCYCVYMPVNEIKKYIGIGQIKVQYASYNAVFLTWFGFKFSNSNSSVIVVEFHLDFCFISK